MASLSADDYLRQLQALLPPGPAWTKDDSAAMTQHLAALADSLARADASVSQLLDEVDPRTAFAFLAEWEQLVGIGDCIEISATAEERRAAVVARLTGTGGQSKQFFVEYARSLGYDVSISEFRPFQAGRAAAGEGLTNENWRHHWMVHAPETTTFDFRAGRSMAGEPLRSWGEHGLECPIKNRKPAHTEVTFSYGE